ncbi:MAG: AMP-binding protein [Candidatus Pelagibacter sp.]
MGLNTVRDHVDNNFKENPDFNFITCPYTKKKITNKNLKVNLEKIYYYLTQKKKLKKNSIICTLAENSLSSIQLILGIMYSGMINVPLNLVAGEDQLSYIIRHSEAKVLFSTKSNLHLAQRIIKKSKLNIELIEIDKNNFTDSLEDVKKKETNELNSSDNALLMYTSGTTGKPKGVMLTHDNILNGGKNVSLSHNLNKLDKVLCVLPLYHINGLIVTVMGPLVSNSSLVLCEKFSATNFWHEISEFKCTWFSIVPTIVSSLINKYSETKFKFINTSLVKFGRSASAALAPETHKNFEKKFKINLIETMGLTETCAPILSNPRDPNKIKYGSPGIAYGNDVKILDNNYIEVKRNEIGQICIRGKNVMKEYYKNPEETKKSFYKDWFLSGDLGLMDDDNFVFVKGRIKELIIKGGENISPREIDDVLYQHPNVIEAAAFGVKCDHYGEKIGVGIVLKENKKSTEEEIIKHCNNHLGKFKSPDKVYFFDELPKGSSGKIQRLKIKDFI